MIKYTLLLLLLCILSLTACNGDNESANTDDSYETTKKMVTDILKTDEGKQSIIAVLSDEETQQMYVIEDKIVQQSINEALTSEEGKDFWTKMFSDQEFVTSFSEAMIDQQEDVFKRLMTDATYQEKMLELLSNPEMDEQILTVIKSQKFRAHLEETIQETFESPLFQAKVAEILISQADELISESGGGSEGESEDDSESEE